MNTPTPPPAGWHNDPRDASRKRFWNGSAWTDHVVDAQSGVPIDTAQTGGPWWKNGWAVGTLAAGGVVLGLALGSGSGETITQTQTVAETITETVPTEISAEDAAIQQEMEDQATEESRAGKREEKRAAVPRGAQHFEGNGSQNLGTITIAQESILRWTNSDTSGLRLFSISDDFENENSIYVHSDAASGQTVVPAGTYRNVEVSFGGDWTIDISPR